MKLLEVVKELKAGWGFNRAYLTEKMGQLLEELVKKANLPDQEVEASYHSFNTGWGHERRNEHFWVIKNFPEITLNYDEYRPLWGRYDFSYDPESKVVSFGYSI